MCVCVGGRGLNFRDCEVRSLIRHSFVQAKSPTLAWFACINKSHQAVESPSHVHRSSANYNCGGMHVSTDGLNSSEKETGTDRQTVS